MSLRIQAQPPVPSSENFHLRLTEAAAKDPELRFWPVWDLFATQLRFHGANVLLKPATL